MPRSCPHIKTLPPPSITASLIAYLLVLAFLSLFVARGLFASSFSLLPHRSLTWWNECRRRCWDEACGGSATRGMVVGPLVDGRHCLGGSTGLAVLCPVLSSDESKGWESCEMRNARENGCRWDGGPRCSSSARRRCGEGRRGRAHRHKHPRHTAAVYVLLTQAVVLRIVAHVAVERTGVHSSRQKPCPGPSRAHGAASYKATPPQPSFGKRVEANKWQHRRLPLYADDKWEGMEVV